MMTETAKERVLAVWPDATATWTSRGWRIITSKPCAGNVIGATTSGHVPEDNAWQDAASRLADPKPEPESDEVPKPCPFCGSIPRVSCVPGRGIYIHCDNDKCLMASIEADDPEQNESVINQWETRAADERDEVIRELVEALKDMDCVLIQEIQYGKHGSQCSNDDQCVCEKHRLTRISHVRTAKNAALARAEEYRKEKGGNRG